MAAGRHHVAKIDAAVDRDERVDELAAPAGKSQSLVKLTTSQRQRLRANAARNAACVSPRSKRSIAIDKVT